MSCTRSSSRTSDRSDSSWGTWSSSWKFRAKTRYGVLGCGGRRPILGGRPREMKKEKRYEMNKRQPKILKAVNIELNGSDSSLDMYANTHRSDKDFRFEDYSTSPYSVV